MKNTLPEMQNSKLNVVSFASKLRKANKAMALAFYRLILILALVAGQIPLAVAPVRADPYPPYWQGGTGAAVHYAPVAWPDEPADPTQCGPECGEWIPYTRYDNSINDPRDHDPSNGGTAPQNYVNIASSCIDQAYPSIYYHIDQTNGVLMFRWRVEQIANTYATGPKAGAYSSADPWNSALWTVFFDLDGDGYLDLAAHLDGSSGSPALAIDRLVGIWGDVPNSQSLDYVNNPNIYALAHNPTGFVDQATDKILNFHDTLTPDTNWPNGAAEMTWDYGTSRSRVITLQGVDGATCDEYFVDYQIPLGLLDASGYGGPKLDQNTAFSMLFCTANSLQNPFQKDCAYQGDWIGDPNEEGPFGDPVSFEDGTINQPIVDNIQANGCGPTTLTASIRDTLVFETEPIPHTSVSDVDFYYYFDENADGLANDGNNWELAASDAVSTGLKTWEATWDTTGLVQGQYILGLQAVDTASLNEPDDDGVRRANRTFSYLSQAEVDALPGNDPLVTGEHWFANPDVTGAVSTATNLNICGTSPPFLTKSVEPAEVTAGETVTFTISISNTYDTPLTLSVITDTLPAGFVFSGTVGVSGMDGPTASPGNGDTGVITWTFSTSVGANSTAVLTFTAQAATTAGTYANLASANTGEGILTADPVEIGVGSPRLTLAKSASTLSALPGDTVTYTISYANDSPVNVTNAVISDVLPTGMIFVSVLDGGSYNAGTLTWNVGDIPSGDGPYTVRFVVTIEDPYPDTAAVPLVNTAYIDADQTDPTSARSSIHVVVSRPALYIQKDGEVLVSPGNTALFTITYANVGNYTATNVIITDTIPVSFTYQSANPAPDSTANGVLVWNSLPDLPVGAGGVIYLTLQIPDPYPDRLDNPAINPAVMDSPQTGPVSDTFDVGIAQTGQACSVYYFRNITTSIGFDGDRRIANTTAPDNPTAAAIVFDADNTQYKEVVRFYQDPGSENDVEFSGDITTYFYIDKQSGPQLLLRAYVYDYDPVTGNKTQLGVQSFTETGGGTNVLYDFTVSASGTLTKGHRLLWLFEASSNNVTQFTFRFDGTPSPSRAEYCVTPPARLVVDKQVSSLIAGPGDTLTYTIKFANIGQTNATGTVLTDTLPAGTTFVAATLNGSPVAPAGSSPPVYSFTVNSVLTTTSGVVEGGDTGELEITVIVDKPLASGIKTLANDVSLESDQTVPITDTIVTTILRPALSISKSANDTLLVPGDTVTYTLTVLNSGDGTATNVTVSDTLPATPYFTYVPNSTRLNGSQAVPDPVSGNLLWYNIGSVGAGQSAKVTFQMEVTSTLAAVPNGVTPLGNTGSVSSTQTGEIESSEVVTVSVTKNPNLYLTKTFAPAGTRAPGDLLTYTLSLENIGGLEAVNVEVQDTIPDDTTYVAGTLVYSDTAQTDANDADDAYFDATNNRVVFDVGNLPAGESRLMTFNVRLDSPLPNGTTPVTNTATAGAGNTSGKTARTTAQVAAAPILTITKSGPASWPYPAAVLTADATNATTLHVDDGSQLVTWQYIHVAGANETQITAIDGTTLTVDAPVTAGAGSDVVGNFSYNIIATNEGDAIANNVTITDTLPAGTAFVTATTPHIRSGDTLTWTFSTLDPGESRLVKVIVIPTATGIFNNTGYVYSDEIWPSEDDTVTIVVGSLRVRKRTTTPVVTQTPDGTSATYVIEVENTLPGAASNVIVTDTLASGFTYSQTVGFTGGTRLPATPDPSKGDEQPAWGTFSIASGATLRITFTAYISETVGPATYQNQVVAVSSDASVTPFDSLLTTDEDVKVQVPVVRLSKTVTPTTVQAGLLVTYTILAENTGDATAQGVIITDSLPSGFSYDSTVSTSQITATRTSIYSNTTPAWGVWDIAPSGRVTITFKARTGPAIGTFSNTISATASNTLIPIRRDLAPVTTTTPTDADLIIAKSDSVDPVAAGGRLTYTLTIANDGPANASGVTVSDTLPSNVTFVSAEPVTSSGTNPLVWNVGNLNVGDNKVITVVVTVDAAISKTLVNTATVTGNEPDPISSNNTVTESTTVIPPVIGAAKAAGAPVDNGDGSYTVLYTVTVENLGDVPLSSLQITDDLASTFAGAAGWAVSAGPGSGTLAVNGNFDGDSDQNLLAGSDTLAIGASATVTFTVVVTPDGNLGPYNNHAWANAEGPGGGPTRDQSTDGTDPDPNGNGNPGDPGEDNPTPVTIPEPGTADLSISKTSQPDPMTPGELVTYTIVVSNAGPRALTAITLTDDLPSAVLGASYFPSEGSYDEATGAWTGLTLGTGEAVTLTIVGTVDPAFVGILRNTAVVTPTGVIDPDPSDNSDTNTNPSKPMLSATKRDTLLVDSDGDGVPSPGDTLSYTVVITNLGGSPATGVVFSDMPDPNATLVTGTVQTSLGTVTSGNNPGDTSVAVDIGTLPGGGGTVNVSFQMRINSPLPAGVTSISNQGLVSSNELSPVPTDDPGTPPGGDPTETPVTAAPDLAATKSDMLLVDADGDGTPSPGDTLLYQVTIVNNGNIAATGVTFSDMPDPNATLVVGTVQTSLGTVTRGNNPGDTSVAVDIGTLPGGGGTVNVSFQVRINSPLPAGVISISNQGLVSSNELPPVPTDDPGTQPGGDPTETLVTASPDLAVTKSDVLLVDADGDGIPSPGDTLLYQVTIVNNGNTALTGVTFSDTPDPNTTLVTGTVQTNLGTVTSGNNPGDTSVAVDIGTLPGGGGTVNVSFQVRINNPLPAGVTSISNQGLVSSNELPPIPTDDPGTPPGGDPTETPVTAAPDLAVTKSDMLLVDADGDGVPSPGDTLLYQVTIVNNGNTALTGVTFSDTPDPNTTLVTGTVQTNLGTVTSGNNPSDTSVAVDIGTLPGGGGTVNISFQVTINDPLPAGVTSISNQGLVSSNELPPAPTDDPGTPPGGDPTETPVTAVPDLAAYKSDVLLMDADGDGIPSPGDTLLYQGTIVNNGNTAATGVIFSDTPDPNTTLVAGTVQTSLGTVTSGNNPGDTSVAVNIGTLPGGGGTVNVSFQVRINSPLPAGVTSINNQGLVSSNELPPVPTDDPGTPPGGDPTETPVTAVPDLAAHKSDMLLVDADGDGIPSPGDTLLYQVTIVNNGNVAATGVTFSDTPDPNTTLVTGTAQTSLGTVTSGNNPGDTSVAVNIGTLPGGGGTVNVSFQVRINSPLPAGVTSISNQGLVSSNELSPVPTDDPGTPPDGDPTVTPVVAAPLIAAYKTAVLLVDADENGAPTPGDTLLYLVSVINDGNVAATDVVFSDTPDPNTTLVAGSVQTSRGTILVGNNPGDTSVTVDIGAIPGGGGMVGISFRVRINGPLPLEVREVMNQGVASSNELPPVPTDDPGTEPSGDPTVTLVPCTLPDAHEPDNFYTEAIEIPTDGTELARNFHRRADKDWVKFRAWAGRVYTITTSQLDPEVDTVLQLYDTDGETLLQENDDYRADSKASRIVWTAPADGWYFVRSIHYDRTYNPLESLICGSDYLIAVEALACTAADAYEPDNFYAEAVEIPTDGVPLARNLHRRADKDWVKFQARAGQVYTITTSQLDPDVDTVLQLYDVNGETLLQENDDYLPDSKASRIVWTAPADGWYFVRSAHFDHTYDPFESLSCGNHYFIAVEAFSCAVTDAHEPDNFYTEAFEIPTNGAGLARSFQRAADKDWLKFRTWAGRVYTITTSQLDPDVDTVLRLYDTDGETLLEENDDYQADSKASRIMWVAPLDGWYFVRITHFDHAYDPLRSLFCGNRYTVALETFTCAVPDTYEPDNFYTEAVEIPTDGTELTRGFQRAGDKDWVKFRARVGRVYTITTSQLDPDVDTVLQLYDVDGETLLQENDDYLSGSKASRIVWTAPANGWYFVRSVHFDRAYDPSGSLSCGGRYAILAEVGWRVLGISKTAEDLNGGLLFPGDQILYTVEVVNLLSIPQTNVVITDVIPGLTTYVAGSASVTQGGVSNPVPLGTISGPDPLVARVGTLQPAQVARLTFRVELTREASGRVIQNTAQAGSDIQVPPVYAPVMTKVVKVRYIYTPIILKKD